MSDQPDAAEVAAAAAELAALEAAIAARSGPAIYQSARRGSEPVESLNARHASRAAALVRRGERPGGPATARALERQAHKPGADHLRG